METLLKNTAPVRLVQVTRDGTPDLTRPTLAGPKDTADLVRPILPKDREGVAVVHLDAELRVISVELIAIGVVDSAPAHAREVFKGAILAGATSIVLAHNHPSGGLEPSEADKKLTLRLMECGKLLDMHVMDMVIVSDVGFRSLIDSGDIEHPITTTVKARIGSADAFAKLMATLEPIIRKSA